MMKFFFLSALLMLSFSCMSQVKLLPLESTVPRVFKDLSILKFLNKSKSKTSLDSWKNIGMANTATFGKMPCLKGSANFFTPIPNYTKSFGKLTIPNASKLNYSPLTF